MAAVGTTVYANPQTFLRMLLDVAQYIEQARREPTTAKEDVLDSIENRLSLLIGKLAAHPTCTAFALTIDRDPPA